MQANIVPLLTLFIISLHKMSRKSISRYANPLYGLISWINEANILFFKDFLVVKHLWIPFSITWASFNPLLTLINLQQIKFILLHTHNICWNFNKKHKKLQKVLSCTALEKICNKFFITNLPSKTDVFI